jgi:hypothetical protein
MALRTGSGDLRNYPEGSELSPIMVGVGRIPRQIGSGDLRTTSLSELRPRLSDWTGTGWVRPSHVAISTVGTGTTINQLPILGLRLNTLWNGRLREFLANHKPMIQGIAWHTKRSSMLINGFGNIVSKRPFATNEYVAAITYPYYDLPITYGDYSGYILYNTTDNILTTIISTEDLGTGYVRVYVENNIGILGIHFKIVEEPPITRVIDYKLQADSKNFYYFSDDNEWVVYHTFDEESYYGNRFYPTIGAVACYDENDSEIHPTDILFYPECIKDGVFEGAKTIIKWASNQSGKVCFNPGFSNEEAKDQSRLIVPVSRYAWGSVFEAIPEGVACMVKIPRDFRSTGVNNIEPFMTVDAIDNGNIVEYAFVYHDVVNPGDDRVQQGLHYGNIKIRADKRFFAALDTKIDNKTQVNTDILNVITIGSNSQWDLVNPTTAMRVFLNEDFSVQNGYHANDSSSDWFRYFIYKSTIVSANPVGIENIDWALYNNDKLYIDNIGWSYDPDSTYKYQMKLYVHGVMPGTSEIELSTTSFTDIPFDTKIISIEKYETFKPLVKVSGLDGYLKIVNKSKSHPIVQVPGGKFEAEYVLEFPSTRGSYYIRSDIGSYGVANQFVLPEDLIIRQETASDTQRDIDAGRYNWHNHYYRYCQIFYPESIVKAGGFYQEFNERYVYNIHDSFTTAVLAESDFRTSAYRRNVGGYEQSSDKLLIGKRAIQYPDNVVYRNVVPNRLDSYEEGYLIEVLLDQNDSPPLVDMRLFILNRNDKWRYNISKYESVSGRENPTYVMEIDSTALLNDYSASFKTIPTLPDMKRWFTAYCRGFAYMENNDYTERVMPTTSSSELVLDIWDNNSVIGTKFLGTASAMCYEGVARYNGGYELVFISGDLWNSADFKHGDTFYVNGVPALIEGIAYSDATGRTIWIQNTIAVPAGSVSYKRYTKRITWTSGDKFLSRRFLEGLSLYLKDPTGSTQIPAGSGIMYRPFSIGSVVDDEYILAVADITSKLTNVEYVLQDTIYEGGNWRSITPSANDSVVIPGSQYINDYRIFKFGGETVVDEMSKIKRYFDLKSTFGPYQTTEFSEVQQSGIISQNESIPLTMFGFSGAGYGSDGAQCNFNPGSYLYNDTDILGLDNYSMCFVVAPGFNDGVYNAGIQFEDTTTFPGTAYCMFGFRYESGIRRFTIVSNANFGWSSEPFDRKESYGQLTDATYVMITKSGNTYTMYACMGHNDILSFSRNMYNQIPGFTSNRIMINNILYGTNLDWSMMKFYMFNRILSTGEFLSFMRDGTGQDLTGADRYIDENGKIYFRSRISRARDFNVRKNSALFDTFWRKSTQSNDGPPSWSTGAIDPSAVQRTENLSIFGLDYFRVESL